MLQLTKLTLLCLDIVAAASAVGDGLMAFMTHDGQCVRPVRISQPRPRQLLEQAVLTDEVFGLYVISQQVAEQLFGNIVFYGCHGAYGFAYRSLRAMSRLRKILNTLSLPLVRFIPQNPHKTAHQPAYEPETQKFVLALHLRDFFEEIYE